MIAELILSKGFDPFITLTLELNIYHKVDYINNKNISNYFINLGCIEWESC